MKEQNQLPNLLKEWAENTVKIYHQIAEKVDIAYYTQSDLSLLTTSPELMIVGINPGSASSYSEQRRNENWSYLYKNPLDGNHLLKGNYCREKGKPSSWDNHRKWKYWTGLRHCLSKTFLLNTIDDDSKIIITNASFFSTKKANEISEELLIETIPQALDLIKISNPKYLLFLSGKKCFERLSSISKSSELVNFEYSHVCGNIYIGNLNGKFCIGIPHPTYKTNEELNLVASVIPYLINVKGYEDIDVKLIDKECSKQIDDYNKKIQSNSAPRMTSGKHLLEEIVKNLNIKNYENISQNPNTYRFKLNESLEITITVTGAGYIGIRHMNYKQKYSIFEYPNTDKYRQVLEEFKYDMTQDMWLGTKSFKKYGNDTENVIKRILDEIDKLQKSLS